MFLRKFCENQVEKLSVQVKDLQRSKTLLEENIASLAQETAPPDIVRRCLSQDSFFGIM